MSGGGRVSDIVSDSDWDSPDEISAPPRVPVNKTSSDSTNTHPSVGNTSRKRSLSDNVQTQFEPTSNVVPSSQHGQSNTPQSVRQNKFSDKSSSSGQKRALAGRTASPDPPYDFTPALTGEESIEKREPQYKTQSQQPKKSSVYEAPAHDQSWDDSDAEAERTLASLRVNFERNKQREEEIKSAVNTPRNQGQQTPPAERSAAPLQNDVRQPKVKVIQQSRGTEPDVTVSARNDSMSSPIRTKAYHDATVVSVDKVDTGQMTLVCEDVPTDRPVYIFEERQHAYYAVNTSDTEARMTGIADRVEKLLQRGYGEVFGVLRIIVMCFTIFVTHLVRFLLQHIFRPVALGVFAILGDFLVKPLLSTLFNNLLQPLLIFLWNVFSGIRNSAQPIIDILRSLSQLVAMILGAFRLVEINWKVPQSYLSHQKGVHEI